jgi:hypothetical protein
MSLRLAGAVAILGLFAVSAEAGTKNFPKPISLTTERVERSITHGSITNKPPQKYRSASWGSRFDLTRDNYPPKPLMPFLLVKSER